VDKIPLFKQVDSFLSDPDVVLMLEFQKGSQQSFEALLIKHYPRVLNFISRYGIVRETAEDIAQEVFLKVYHSAAQYRPRAKFQTWLLTMVRNAALNALRDQRKNAFSLDEEMPSDDGGMKRQLADSSQKNAQEELIDQERAEIIQAAINGLPENQRWAVLLKRYDNMSYEEIAQTMNCSVMAVKSLLSRAKESLAGTLAKLDKKE
jgi:RNA polymerase sigma-70 factor (ECF subfamily)